MKINFLKTVITLTIIFGSFGQLQVGANNSQMAEIYVNDIYKSANHTREINLENHAKSQSTGKQTYKIKTSGKIEASITENIITWQENKAGEATIIVSFEADGYYDFSQKEFNLIIDKGTHTITGGENIKKSQSDDRFIDLNGYVKSSANYIANYSILTSGNLNAKISSDNILTWEKHTAGTSIIRAKFLDDVEDHFYGVFTKDFSITVQKAMQDIIVEDIYIPYTQNSSYNLIGHAQSQSIGNVSYYVRSPSKLEAYITNNTLFWKENIKDTAIIVAEIHEDNNFYYTAKEFKLTTEVPDYIEILDIKLHHEQNRPFNFNPKIKDYNFYIRSVDSKEVILEITKMHSSDVIILPDGKIYDGKYKIEIEESKTFIIKVINNNIYQEYTINFIVSENIDSDPHIFVELRAFKGSNNAELIFYGQNVRLNQIKMQIQNFDFDFHTKNLNPLFEKSKIKLKNSVLDIDLSTKKSEYIEITEREEIFRISMDLINKNGIDSDRILALLSIKTSNIYDEKYGDIIDINAINDIDEKSTLSYITEATKHYIYMQAKNYTARAIYDVYDVSDGKRELITHKAQKIAPYSESIFQEIYYGVYEGEYAIRVRCNGFIIFNTENVIATGVPIISSIKLYSMSLLAGDLNDDGVIDVTDRKILIPVYNRVVGEDGGALDEFGNMIYGDINGDGFINVLDAGLMCRNLGRKYDVGAGVEK